MISLAEHADLQKTRRSLFAASFYTILVSNVEFLSQEISLFGLKLSVKQSELIAFGRLAIAILFALFLVHAFSSITGFLKRRAEEQYEIREATLKQEAAQLRLELEHPNGFASVYDPEEWEVIFSNEAKKILLPRTG
ncbi:MAG: hypothetical protein ABJL67_15560 [Sulfitobacter sp.]